MSRYDEEANRDKDARRRAELSGEIAQMATGLLDNESYREVRTAVLGSMKRCADALQRGRTEPVTAAELLAAFPVEGDSP